MIYTRKYSIHALGPDPVVDWELAMTMHKIASDHEIKLEDYMLDIFNKVFDIEYLEAKISAIERGEDIAEFDRKSPHTSDFMGESTNDM